MADLLDPAQRSQLASGPVVLHVAEDELDRFRQPAWRIGLPDFARYPPRTIYRVQRVSRNGLGG